MMSNHTPGPWRINEGGKYYDELHRICKDGNGMIATVVNIADANLIAASPDLFESCEDVLALHFEIQSTFEESPLPKELVAKLQAAIAKARGE
jgi:hypothetical protein